MEFRARSYTHRLTEYIFYKIRYFAKIVQCKVCILPCLSQEIEFTIINHFRNCGI